MKYFDEEINKKHKALISIIRKKDRFDEVRTIFNDIHSQLYASSASGTEKNAMDLITEKLSPEDYAVMPTKKDITIAWSIWHITRIEDLITNYLITDGEQVFNDEWMKKMHTTVRDTGNAMNEDEVIELSRSIDASALLGYRNAVCLRTRSVFSTLTADDMKRKPTPEGYARILSSGGLTKQPGSAWLLDYWGDKDIAGLILMPLTRHPMFHLNSCGSIAERISTYKEKGKKFYR